MSVSRNDPTGVEPADSAPASPTGPLPTSVPGLLTAAAVTLRSHSPTPRLDAELLLGHVLGWSRARLLAARSEPLEAEHVAAFQGLIERRATGEPVAYLIGHREFYGLDLLVDRRVLTPRPETELLVEQALAVAAAMAHRAPLRIADVGTGSGAIAIALAVHLPDAQIYATDLAPEALAVAAANAARHGVAERVTLLQGDLLTPVTERLEIIVSNPPYTILDQIDANVRRHEPHLALDGGPDGLEIYRRLLAQAPRWLRLGGALVLEIGALQGPAVTALVQAALPTARVAVVRDLAGHDRVVVGRLQAEEPDPGDRATVPSGRDPS